MVTLRSGTSTSTPEEPPHGGPPSAAAGGGPIDKGDTSAAETLSDGHAPRGHKMRTLFYRLKPLRPLVGRKSALRKPAKTSSAAARP